MNIKKLKENNKINNPFPEKNTIIKKRGKGTLTFQISVVNDKKKNFVKKDIKIRASSYEIWGLVMDKIKECPNFYFNQKIFYDYLINYIEIELRNYVKVEKIIKIIEKMESERVINRAPEEIQFIQKETEEIFTKENKEELKQIFLKDDTLEVLDNQKIIHTYEYF